MVCGLNVFHETQDCQISVMGLASTYNRTLTKYWTTTQVMDKPGQLVCSHAHLAILDAIIHFKEVNESYPDQVIIYRDAGSGTDLRALKAIEITQIE
jgi:hypothetical protein